MTLHPDSIHLVELIRAAAGAGGELTVELAREGEVQRHRLFDPPPQPVDSVAEVEIPGTSHATPAMVYTPSGRPEGVLVHFHGGGWTIGSPELVDPQVRALANAGSCVVVSVDYRLAPENPYPAGLDDAFTSAAWAVDNASDLGSSPERVIVGGSSSGGNLAAAVCIMARDRGGPGLAGQLLIYPATSRDIDTESRRAPSGELLVSLDVLMWFWGHYLSPDTDASDPYVSPLLVPDTTGLPPAVVVTAEHDVLRDEGEAYAQRLRDGGATVAQRRFDGMLHGFLAYAGVVEPAGEAVEWIGHRLRQVFAGELSGVGAPP